MSDNNRCKFDPKLEVIRNNIPKGENTDKIAEELIELSNNIPAGYLFEHEGIQLLQKLCLLLSCTPSNARYSGWEEFGIVLGLEPPLLKSIKYNYPNQDPATNTLLAYVQRDHATLDKIIQSLHEIQRPDIILQCKDSFTKTCNAILNRCIIKGDDAKFILPPTLPSCPFLFQDITKINFKKKEQQIKEKLIQEKLQTATPRIGKAKHNYKKIVMLTYASDANGLIEQIAKKLRVSNNVSRTGVLILNEHKNKVNLCPEQFISEYFWQVTYVMPILTKGYLKSIMENNFSTFGALGNIDNKYVKYIYRLMNTDYLRNGCKNTKVRCIIPDEDVINIQRHPLMADLLFQVWIKISEIDEFVAKILLSDL